MLGQRQNKCLSISRDGILKLESFIFCDLGGERKKQRIAIILIVINLMLHLREYVNIIN